MAKGDDIQERLIDFAVSIIQLTTPWTWGILDFCSIEVLPKRH